MTTLKAHFDGKVLVPDEPVNLPVGCVLKVQVETTPEPASNSKPLQDLVELAKKFPVSDWPADGAAQHDHYLYGTPKKT